MKEIISHKKIWLFSVILTLSLAACSGRSVPSPADGEVVAKGSEATATVGLPADLDMGEAAVDDSEEILPTFTSAPTEEPTATLVPTETSVPPTATDTPTPAPTATPIPFTSFIYGRVYHDACINDIELHYKESDGAQCLLDKEGKLVANGTFDEGETGLADVMIELFLGACPSTEFVGKVATNGEGFYVFPNIPPGDYCLTLNPDLYENVLRTPNLRPGTITSPTEGSHTVTLIADSAQSDVDFGWDFENLPEPGKACTDLASVIANGDESSETRYISNNLAFEQSWEVQNDGTCTWNPDYTLALSIGHQLGLESSFSIGQTVRPGETATISHTFTTPDEKGGYLGAWELRNEYNDLVPLGTNGAEKLIVDINVAPGILANAYGKPYLFDTFDNGDNWVTSKGTIGSFSIQEGRMVMTAFDPTGKETWLLAGPDIENGYIEASFSTTEQCNPLDRYGLVVRSQQINRGYFLGLNCDGQWSLRKWTGARWETLVYWTADENIRKGAGQNNVLGVYMDEGSFEVFINGVRIKNVGLDDKFDHNGRVGLFIASKQSEDLVIYVEEIGMWIFP